MTRSARITWSGGVYALEISVPTELADPRTLRVLFTPLSEQYDVMSMPTLVIFKEGEVIDRIVGSLPIDQVRTQIQKNL